MIHIDIKTAYYLKGTIERLKDAIGVKETNDLKGTTEVKNYYGKGGILWLFWI